MTLFGTSNWTPYLIYNALKESVFLHCNIGIFSKYYVHRVFGLIRKNHWSMHSRSAVFLNNTKTPDFTFLGVKSGVHFTICWFSAFIAERQGFEPRVPRSTTVFKTAAIDHSATSPNSSFKKSFSLKAMQRYKSFFILQTFLHKKRAIIAKFLFIPTTKPA